MNRPIKAKYLLSSVGIDEDGLVTFEAKVEGKGESATFGNLAISVDLANLLMSDDDDVRDEVLAMITQLVEQQAHGYFCDDDTESGNLRHAIVDTEEQQ